MLGQLDSGERFEDSVGRAEQKTDLLTGDHRHGVGLGELVESCFVGVLRSQGGHDFGAAVCGKRYRLGG